MASYVVFDRPDADYSPVLVRDSFRWGAFLVPFLWFLWHRLWVEAFVVLAARIGFAALWEVKGIDLLLISLALLLSLALGFEAPQLRMAALRRRGWKEEGVVEADDVEEAEIRMRDANRANDDEGDPPSVARPVLEKATAPSGVAYRPGLGLLNYPGGS